MGPITRGGDVTPDDGADFVELTRGLLLGSSGDVSVTFANGSTLVLPNLASGMVHPFRVKRVNSTGTTASGIKALY